MARIALTRAELCSAWRSLLCPTAATGLCEVASSRGLATHSVGSAAPKEAIGRFYKDVGVQEDSEGQGFHVTLDSRVLKTPAKRPLNVPTEALAQAIAAEWECQTKRVQPFTMPLMTLAATAIDMPREAGIVVDTLLDYLHTDGLLCREAPGKLATLQAETYEPILDWARERLGADLRASDSIFGAALPESDVAAVRTYLARLDGWHLTAVEHLAAACRSVLLACAVLEGQVGVRDALAVARLEESTQIAEWGLVEGGHDIDIADLKVRIAAPSVFIRLLKLGPQQLKDGA